MKLYEMTIYSKNIEAFKKCLEEEFSGKITIEKEVYIRPLVICHLNTSDITRRELALLQDRFLL